jgi:hypothetical protein
MSRVFTSSVRFGSRRSESPLDIDKAGPDCGGQCQIADDGARDVAIGIRVSGAEYALEAEAEERLGFFSNRLMIYWTAATFTFVLIVMLVLGDM